MPRHPCNPDRDPMQCCKAYRLFLFTPPLRGSDDSEGDRVILGAGNKAETEEPLGPESPTETSGETAETIVNTSEAPRVKKGKYVRNVSIPTLQKKKELMQLYRQGVDKFENLKQNILG